MIVPPVELEEYNDIPSSFDSLQFAKDRQKEQAERLVKIQEIVDLEDLNEEERKSLLSLFFEFSFQLGLVGYYRRFIPNFAKISKPLTFHLKNNVVFKWNLSRKLSKHFEIRSAPNQYFNIQIFPNHFW